MTKDASEDEYYPLDNLEVTLGEAVLVTTASQSPREYLFLSSLDIFWRDFHYNRRILFYALSCLDEQAAAIAALKTSLSKVLVHFYPAAGRLAFVDGRTVIDCNDEGVEFVEATVDAAMDELRRLNFQTGPLLNKLARQEELSLSEIYSVPLLSIQVTKFRCGGFAVGYAHSHAIADGHSMWHFMNSWAECARCGTLSRPPLHMRTALKLDKPSEDRAFVVFPPEEPTLRGQVGATIPSKPLEERVFHVTAEMIKKLKTEANWDGSQSSFTSYEVLCAHWWKRITMARELEAATLVRFVLFADMRTRLNPPLPPTYFGNAVMFKNIFATAGEIRNESLGATAARIHDGVTSCNEKSLWEMIHWLELHGCSFGSKLQTKLPTVKATSSPRFPVNSVDFGWGVPAAVRTAKIMGNGEMVLFPGREGEGGVVICVPLPHETMLKLQNDLVLRPEGFITAEGVYMNTAYI